MNFEYTDSFNDTLELKDCPHLGAISLRVRSDNDLVSVLAPYADVGRVATALVESGGEECYIIPKSDATVGDYRGWLCCGEGKDYVETPSTTNPEGLLKKAANLVAIAKEIQRRKGVAAAEQSLQARRDKVTQELAGNAKARYELATDLAKKAIDRIIATEDKKKESKNA